MNDLAAIRERDADPERRPDWQAVEDRRTLLARVAELEAALDNLATASDTMRQAWNDHVLAVPDVARATRWEIGHLALATEAANALLARPEPKP